ncbi:MAG: nuclear transport factor 2 family protein [Thermodesulfobacteriota bacterium]
MQTTDDDPIHACEEELRRAQLAGDVAALERLLDDALVFTALDGSLVGKADDLALHRSGRLEVLRMDPGERHVLRFGTIAVVSVRMEATAKVDGALVSGPLRYTRVWRETPHGWRVVAGHMSAVQG